MTFPFSFHANFETGTRDTFDGDSDAGDRLDFPGPQQLKRDMMSVFPHRGGYCMRVNLGKVNTPAYVSETVTWAADSTNFMRFEFLIGDNVQIGNDGNFVDIMTLSSGVDEAAICLARVEPAGMVLALRDPGFSSTATSITDYLSVEPGNWMCIEAQVDVDAGGGNDGSVIVWVGNDRIRIGNLDQAALTSVRFGAVLQVGDFTGHIYFDEILFDTARLHPDYGPNNLRLDGETMPIFKSGWAFVGPGTVMGCTLIDGSFTGGAGDGSLKVYDTDDVSFAEHMVKEVLATTVDPVVHSQALSDGQYLFRVNRGAFVALSGDNPSALIRIGTVDTME